MTQDPKRSPIATLLQSWREIGAVSPAYALQIAINEQLEYWEKERKKLVPRATDVAPFDIGKATGLGQASIDLKGEP